MKYNININQVALAKFEGIDLKDGAILSYIKDFSNSPSVAKIIHDDDIYYFISYSHLLAQMPLLKIKTKDGIYRRMKKLANAKIIKFHPDNQKLGKPFFAFGENYESIIQYVSYGQETVGVRMKNRRGYGQETVGGTDEKPNNNNTSNNNTSNNIKTDKAKIESSKKLPSLDAEKKDTTPPSCGQPPQDFEAYHQEMMDTLKSGISDANIKAYTTGAMIHMTIPEFWQMVAEMIDHYADDYGFKKNPTGFIKRKVRGWLSSRKFRRTKTQKSAPKNELKKGKFFDRPAARAANAAKWEIL